MSQVEKEAARENDISKEEWKALFNALDTYNKKVEQQKSRGLNNYSLLNSVLKSHDEVKLHSGFIASMLSPNGSHYQGALFLKFFLKAIGKDGWLEEGNAIVTKERCLSGNEDDTGRIDIHITDGNRHIVIENKIWAEDQEGQVARYIQQVNDIGTSRAEDILFIYLTNEKKPPNKKAFKYKYPSGLLVEHALNRAQSYVVVADNDKETKAMYLNITYDIQMREWVRLCKKEVKNLCNLHYAFSEYEIIIDKITRRYKGNIMKLYEFVKDNKFNASMYSKGLLAVQRQLPVLQANSINDFIFTTVDGLLKSKGYLQEEWGHELKVTPDFLKDFFAAEKRVKNRGVKWKQKDSGGEIVIFIGLRLLHLGVVSPVEPVSNEPDIKFKRRTTKGWNEVFGEDKTFYSFGKSARDASIELIDCENNDFYRALQILIKHFNPE